jgi:hypothetical protein
MAQRMSDDPVTWGQLMAFQARIFRRFEKTVKDEVAKVDFNGALGRLRILMPELEHVAQMVRDQEGAERVRRQEQETRHKRWRWVAFPRAVLIAIASGAAGVIVAKLLG